MSTSRSVDRLTYTYYTGQDGSEPHGPNCPTCMNELFHENKLMDVQMVFITSPSGLIPFTTRSLVYSYGVEAPFSMTLSTEDFLVVSCTQCAQKAIRLELSEAMKADKEGASIKTTKKRGIKMVISHEDDSDGSSLSSVAKRVKAPSDVDHLMKCKKIPFVTGFFTAGKGMNFEKLFNYLTFLKRSELMDDGFSQYMLRIYPNIKNINVCSLCEIPICCDHSADGYFKHFLSSRHIAKAVGNHWNLGVDFGLFLVELSNYLKEDGRADKASNLTKQIKTAAKEKMYSKNCEKYKHLF